MELVGVEDSVLTALFIVRRPEGQPHLPQLFAQLVERYKFASYPTRIEDMIGDKVQFKEGAFENTSIASLDVYRDGVVVTSKSPTWVLDQFLDDLLVWLQQTAGLKRIETQTPNKNYESHILVKSDADILKSLGALESVRLAIERSLKETTGIDAKYSPFGIAFAADHAVVPGMRPISFRLERRAALAFSSNIYISSAPLRTIDHMKVLEMLEKLR